MAHRAVFKQWIVTWRGRRLGLEISPIGINDRPYMDRYVVYLAGLTLRLHKFYRGDDDRASHTHPWWFVTFPLRSYVERVYENGTFRQEREVKAFRFHYRPASFEHIVVTGCPDGKPFYTLVLSGMRRNSWGFYPSPGRFIPWREFR